MIAAADTGRVERFDAMGCTVLTYGATPQEHSSIVELFAERESTFSRFIPDSELARVNAATAAAIVVSETFASGVRDAIVAARATSGLVDPTLGDAVVAAGYDVDLAQLPADGPAPRAGRTGRWHDLRIADRLVSRPVGVALDLNGVVKGRTVDDALALLSGNGFVSAGGDIATRGSLRVLLPGGGAVRVGAGGVATAGRVKRRWQRGGRQQHHLIDPRTGRPSTSRWTEVTVVAGSCLGADVAARAAFLLDADGPAWLDERELPGRFLSPSGAVGNDTWARLGLYAGGEPEGPCTG
jgi:thiamine biosynthesis lipoprotein